MLRQIIIVGGGRVGRHSAAKLTDDGFMVTVIEKDADMCEQFPAPLAGRVIEGDGTDIETLQQANAGTADIVAALTDDVETNLLVCELAEEIAPDAETHLRIDDDGQEAYAHLDHVDNIVYPAALAAKQTVKQISQPVS
jgi:trk system potassium uptake protein TrkA